MRGVTIVFCYVAFVPQSEEIIIYIIYIYSYNFLYVILFYNKMKRGV